MLRSATVAVCAGLVGAARPAAASGPLSDLLLDGGLVVAKPAALPTGLSTGVGAGVTGGAGLLAWGARAAWSTATEYTTDYTVAHSDTRLRAVGALRHVMGRGTVALRLELGGTLVHEVRTRDQGKRAGLSGSALRSTAWQMLPAADVELTVGLRIAGSWGMVLGGGPSVVARSGALHAGWIGSLGVTWTP